MKELIDAMADMQEEKLLQLTKEYLDEGKNPVDIFKAYQIAMEEVGSRFEKGVYFIPELILSGEMMGAGAKLIKPYLGKDQNANENTCKGKLLLATIEGDIHDIGKDIFGMLMELNGFEVMDLGVDVPSQTIIQKAKEFNPDIIGVSGLLTLAFDPMKKFVEALKEEGIRDKFKVQIGGAQITEQVCEYIGADAFATDAVTGVNQCKAWMTA